MELSSINNQKELDIFLKENNGSLLQSWSWGEFQKSIGRKIYRFSVNDKGNKIASAQLVKYRLPLGKSYLYCPRGPVLSTNRKPQITNRKDAIKLLLEEVSRIAKEENAIFLRIDPEISANSELARLYEGQGFRFAKKQIQPANTLILDIGKNENDILSKMHHKTRYNIRLAQRKGIKVRKSIDLKDVDLFYKLLKKTSARDKFRPHPKDYYKQQIKILGKNNFAMLFSAELKGKFIAAIIVSFFSSTATYLHGASDINYRKYMAPHLLQWQAILEAKKRGFRFYDFWGIAPKASDSGHPWAGITRFKKGFGGQEIYFAGAMDYIFRPVFYNAYNFFKK